MNQNIEQNIVTESNKTDFISYVLNEKPDYVTIEMYKILIELEMNTFIENEHTWMEAQHVINTIAQTQKIIGEKPNKKQNPKNTRPKNTRPTNRKEKANLLAEAAEKRMNKYSKKNKKLSHNFSTFK